MHLGWRFLIFKAPGIYKYKEPKTQGKVERVTTSGAQTRFEEEGASEQVKRGGENQIFGVKHHANLHGGKTRKPHLDIYI